MESDVVVSVDLKQRDQVAELPQFFYHEEVFPLLPLLVLVAGVLSETELVLFQRGLFLSNPLQVLDLALD